MDYYILMGVIILNTALFLVSGAYGKRKSCDPFLFSAFTALVTVGFFAVYNQFRFRWDGYTAGLSLIYSVSYIVGMAANVYAMKYGSVALTSMIASFSLLLPTVFGIVYWKEETSPLFLLGLALFCVSLVLTKYEGRQEKAPKEVSEKDRRKGVLWTVAVAVLFFTNGFSSILSTFHQKTGGESFRGEFMVLSMSIVFVVNMTLAVLRLKKETATHLKGASVYGIAYGLLNSGIRLGVMMMAASGVINQSVFFPVISGSVIVLVFVFSAIVFKERFRKLQYVGVILGIVSIVLLQI